MLTHVSALHGFPQLIKGLFKVKLLYPLKEVILENIAKKLGRKL